MCIFQVPDLSWVRVRGSCSFSHLTTAEKFEDRELIGVHGGYDRGMKGYISFLGVFTGSTVSNKDTVFHEEILSLSYLLGQSGLDREVVEVMYSSELLYLELEDKPKSKSGEVVIRPGIVSN